MSGLRLSPPSRVNLVCTDHRWYSRRIRTPSRSICCLGCQTEDRRPTVGLRGCDTAQAEKQRYATFVPRSLVHITDGRQASFVLPHGASLPVPPAYVRSHHCEEVLCLPGTARAMYASPVTRWVYGRSTAYLAPHDSTPTDSFTPRQIPQHHIAPLFIICRLAATLSRSPSKCSYLLVRRDRGRHAVHI